MSSLTNCWGVFPTTAAFMVALGYGVSTNSEFSELSSSVNLSALSGVSAQGENTGAGNTVTCYSESRYRRGASYWDCGDCTRYSDARGKGATSTCTT